MTRRPDQPTLHYPTTTIEPWRVPSPTAPPTDPGPPQRMQRIAGIDFSLTATGIAIITRRTNGTCIINTTTIKTKGSNADSIATKYQRLNQLAHDIKHAAGPLIFALIEGLNHHGKGRLDDRARTHAGWWMTVGSFVKADIPIAIISPASVKLAITDKSAADKSVMGGYIKKLWPGLDYDNENEADAAAIAHLGAVRLGWNVATLERHKQVKAEWPEFGVGSALGLTGSDDLGATA